MQIRLAIPDDIPEIDELWKDFMDYHKNLDEFFSRRNDGHINFRDYVVENWKNPDYAIAVAEHQDHVVGYAIAYLQEFPPIFLQEKCCYISDIVMDENFQGKGHGKALINFLVDWAKTKEVQRMELHVLHNNENAIMFYRHLGFEPFMLKLCRKIN